MDQAAYAGRHSLTPGVAGEGAAWTNRERAGPRPRHATEEHVGKELQGGTGGQGGRGPRASIVNEWAARSAGQPIPEDGMRIPLKSGALEAIEGSLVHNDDEARARHVQRQIKDIQDRAHIKQTMEEMRAKGRIRRPSEQDWRRGVLLAQLHVPNKRGLLAARGPLPGHQHKPRMCFDGTDALAKLEDIAELPNNTITLEELAAAARAAGPGAHGIAADWKSGYNQVRLDERDHRLAGVLWSDALGGDNEVWLFTVAHFGKRCAGGLFARLVRPFIRELRRRMAEVTSDSDKVTWIKAHVDDMIAIAPSKDLAQKALEEINKMADEAGIELSPGKEQPPTTVLHVLGVELDLKRGRMTLPVDKHHKHLERMRQLLEHLRDNNNRAPRHAVDTVAGGIQYLSGLLPELVGVAPVLLAALPAPPATDGEWLAAANARTAEQWRAAYELIDVTPYNVGVLRAAKNRITSWNRERDVAPVFDRRGVRCVAEGSLSSVQPMTDGEELRQLAGSEEEEQARLEWQAAIDQRRMLLQQSVGGERSKPIVVILSDASATGTGVTIRTRGGQEVEMAAGFPHGDIANTASAARELVALSTALAAMADIKEIRGGGPTENIEDTNQAICWFVDALAATQALHRTYSITSPDMERALHAVWVQRRRLETAWNCRIAISAQWRPRAWLQREDQLSRVCEPGSTHALIRIDNGATRSIRLTQLEQWSSEAGAAAEAAAHVIDRINPQQRD